MRLGEQCPYITPCGFCSRQGKPCDGSRKKEVNIAIRPLDLTDPQLVKRVMEGARSKGGIDNGKH